MSVGIIIAIAIMAFLVLILLEIPVGLSIAIAGLLGIALTDGVDVAGSVLASAPYTGTAKYALFVVPMYILLGSLVSNAGIGERIYGAINRLIPRLPGGLAAAAVGATAIFSGISGSSAADVATFGRISVREMTRNGYGQRYAAAVVAAAGTFAVLIPPSIVVVLYGIIAQQSIGALILAGVIPGVLSALVLMGFVVIRAMVYPPSKDDPDAVAMANESPAAPDGAAQDTNARSTRVPPTGRRPSARHEFGGLVYAAILFAIVVGGLYGGIFTPTEAGAVGAFAALVIAVIVARSARRSIPKVFVESLREATDVTSMIFLLIIGGAIFTYFVASAGVPTAIAEWVVDLPVSPTLLVALFLLILLPMGMFLDGLSILLLTAPIVVPIVVHLGFDGVWFGILMIKMIEIGLITPPVGINVYIISGIVGLPVQSVFRKVLPFVVLDIAFTALLFAVPDIVTWLPRQAGLS